MLHRHILFVGQVDTSKLYIVFCGTNPATCSGLLRDGLIDILAKPASIDVRAFLLPWTILVIFLGSFFKKIQGTLFGHSTMLHVVKTWLADIIQVISDQKCPTIVITGKMLSMISDYNNLFRAFARRRICNIVVFFVTKINAANTKS